MAVKLGDGFSVLLSDCPWDYDNPQDHDSARGGPPYELLKVEDLCAMKPLIDQVVNKDCVLFQWATWPKLKESITVIEGWGFELKTVAFKWTKLNPKGSVRVMDKNMSVLNSDEGVHDGFRLAKGDIVLHGGLKSGTGYHTNANSEIVLLGKRGHPQRARKDIKQIVFAPEEEEFDFPPDGEEILAPVGAHSAKPEEVRLRIEQLMGGVPGLELFARPPGRVPGWVKMGWEIDGQDIRVMLQQLIDGKYERPKVA